MTIVRGVVAPCAIGGAFGAANSLFNHVAPPPGAAGAGLPADTLWGSLLRVASMVTHTGWAWAAVAVGVGWLAGTLAWGSVAGVVAMLAGTVAYYFVDSGFRLSHFEWGSTEYWGTASIFLGPLLGALGASIRRPGVVGLLASLVVPAGAVLQMLLLPPDGGVPAAHVRPEAIWTRSIVLGAAGVAAGLLIARFALRSRSRRR